MTTTEITKYDDIIDSRDVIARIEELEGERDSQADPTGPEDTADAIAARVAEWDASDEGTELKALQALASEAEGYAADWQYGEALIRDSHFEEYAQQLADDICSTPTIAIQWPYTCIDWAQAARELQQDYTAVSFSGVTYWIR